MLVVSQILAPDECDVPIYNQLLRALLAEVEPAPEDAQEPASHEPTECPDCQAPVKSRNGLRAHKGARGKCPGPKTKETS